MTTLPRNIAESLEAGVQIVDRFTTSAMTMTFDRQFFWAIALLAPFALASCDNPEYWVFQEEVVMNTGEHVRVQRKLRRNNVWPHISADGYRAIVDDWLSEPTHHVEWQSSKQGNGHPVSIGIVSGQVYVVTVGNKSLQYCLANPSAYNVFFFRQTSQRWEEVDQSAELLDGLTQNLLLTLDWGERSEPKPSMVTLQDKAERDRKRFSLGHSVRQYLDMRYGAKCKTTLQLAGRTSLSGASDDSDAHK